MGEFENFYVILGRLRQGNMFIRSILGSVLAFCLFLLVHVGCLAQDTVYVKKAGSLSDLLSPEKQESCTMLVLSGKLNSADIRLLRRMAGYSENGEKGGKLKYLSLKDCSLVKDKEPFMVLDAQKEHLSGTALPAVVVTLQFGKGILSEMKKTVHSYQPEFYLGHFTDERILSETSTYKDIINSHVNEGSKPILRNVGDFRFGFNMNDAKWAEMKALRIIKFEGHQIVRQGDKYEIRAYLSGKSFPHDTFYKCHKLKTLVLPKKMKLNTFVRDELSMVRMVEGK